MATNTIWTWKWEELGAGRARASLLRDGEELISADGADRSMAVQNALAAALNSGLDGEDLESLRDWFYIETGGTPAFRQEKEFGPLLTDEQQQALIEWLEREARKDRGEVAATPDSSDPKD